MGARCRAKHAQLLTESEISLTWALACGVDPASCELQAASCKVTKKSSLAPVGSILRAASCKLRACEQQKSRSKVDPRTCEAAARQRCRLPVAAVGHHARTTSRVHGPRDQTARDRARAVLAHLFNR